MITRVLPAHGGQLTAISAAFSVPADRLLDFSASIYPYGPSPRVIEALSDALRIPEQLRRYPDLESIALRANLETYAAVPAGNIVVANGIVSLISTSLRAMQVRRCLLPVPAFAEYRRIFERDRIEFHTYLLDPNANFRPDLELMIEYCVAHSCDSVILNNPHNPSGVTFAATEMRTILTLAAWRNIRIFLDEAFIDFVPEESISNHVLQTNNLIVFRSVTKFFAMAGLRVAYLIAPHSLVPTIANLLDPWSVSTLASLAAGAAVQDSSYISNTIQRNSTEREWLSRALAGIGLTVFPGRANFLLIRLPKEREGANVWERLIVDHGIVVRNCGNFEGLDGSFMRVAVRGREDNQRLIRAFTSVMNRNIQTMRMNS
ncbi:MAG TPA: threonine-phosphate decarboxylase [Blastocatellia bacterium]|nr:threonine-phosphate decarboxylase [Blastocatellia bacterium]